VILVKKAKIKKRQMLVWGDKGLTFYFPQKLKIFLSYDPAIPLQFIYPKEIILAHQRPACPRLFLN
jgi:hypothetical protein